MTISCLSPPILLKNTRHLFVTGEKMIDGAHAQVIIFHIQSYSMLTSCQNRPTKLVGKKMLKGRTGQQRK